MESTESTALLDPEAAAELLGEELTGEPQFPPGAVLASRYRIVALLGYGGMGEVYRANDLKLGQPVALKFLDPVRAADAAARARFHREVRLARQISHPNVCRVFDLGEVDGQSFLSMEYVDGEDLSVLLRRIRRLPADKATELARQFAAGLAAIHESGLLHRDLKPANLMIDGRGRARITDFSVAVLAGERRISNAGTPAYMAPEQRERGETTIQSDLYSLALVLYEMFTGRPVLSMETTESRITRPGDLAPGIDSRTEAILLRCLERDPRKRPASALELLAGLPGSHLAYAADPLAAALAAGETPSPEAVAGAARVGGLRPPAALACLAGVIVLLAALLPLSGHVLPYRQVPLEHPPEVLADRAHSLLRGLRPTPPAADQAYGFAEHEAFARYLLSHPTLGGEDPVRRILTAGRPPLLWFWYRESPEALVPGTPEVRLDDPPRRTPGEAALVLDPTGRLYQLEVVPQVRPDPVVPDPPPDWNALLGAAGFDPAQLASVSPLTLPPAYADHRAAWVGTFPGLPGLAVPVRIEAASYRGAPISFEIYGPWRQPAREALPERPGPRLSRLLADALFLLILVTTALLARRSLRLGRGDRRGAARFALAIFGLSFAGWLLGGKHTPGLAEISLAARAASTAIVRALLVWAFYLGLEPYLRRRWPERIISWTRLLAGQVRDPLLGRDLLVGCLAGLLICLTTYGEKLLTDQLHGTSALDVLGPNALDAVLDSLHGAPHFVQQILSDLTLGIIIPFGSLVLLVLLRLLLGRERPAILMLWALFTLVLALQTGNPAWEPVLLSAGLKSALYLFIWTRFGLLAGVVAHCVRYFILSSPLTVDLTSWYAGNTAVVLLLIVGLALFGFTLAVMEQRWLRSGVLDD
ncbi:MAG TPA: serine/threonine-protein kinase [Thermoanaerobaculia bacterium]|nr:serine/threonine-protein kinase [Thermoanaerobaculia bacterium]